MLCCQRFVSISVVQTIQIHRLCGVLFEGDSNLHLFFFPFVIAWMILYVLSESLSITSV